MIGSSINEGIVLESIQFSLVAILALNLGTLAILLLSSSQSCTRVCSLALSSLSPTFLFLSLFSLCKYLHGFDYIKTNPCAFIFSQAYLYISLQLICPFGFPKSAFLQYSMKSLCLLPFGFFSFSIVARMFLM